MLPERQPQVEPSTRYYSLHHQHASQLSLFGLELFWQILAPGLKPCMKLAQLSKLGLLRQRLVEVGGMVKVV